MNKLISTFFSLIIGFSTFSQQFEIPAEKYPFYSILEWKGMGAILLNRDPSGNSKKVNLTLVSDKTTSIWQESINPNGKDFHFISSENTRYVYILDNLEPELGRVSLHQLNSAGNIKSTSVSLTAAIKKLGAYDINELQLIDVVTTDKALVHIFRYYDSKEKRYTEIATFITHHNLLVYASIIGEIPADNIKDKNYGMWKYIGFTDDQIYFAARDYQNSKKGWSVKNFTSKGTLTDTRFIHGPKDDYDFIEEVGIGTNGKTILNKNSESENAVLSFINNTLYMSGLQTDGDSKVVKLKELKEGEWVDLSSQRFKYEASKKAVQFGTMPLNEGFGFKIGNIAVFLPYSASAKQVQSTFNELYNSNPSRFVIDVKKEHFDKLNTSLFAVSLAEGNLFFDLNQLNKIGNVKFEFSKK